MSKLVNSIMLSCKKATELIEKNQVSGLSFKESLQLKAHKMVCEACRNYEKQSIFLEKVIQKQFNKPTGDFHPDIDLKKIIKQKLEEQH